MARPAGLAAGLQDCCTVDPGRAMQTLVCKMMQIEGSARGLTRSIILLQPHCNICQSVETIYDCPPGQIHRSLTR